MKKLKTLEYPLLIIMFSTGCTDSGGFDDSSDSELMQYYLLQKQLSKTSTSSTSGSGSRYYSLTNCHSHSGSWNSTTFSVKVTNNCNQSSNIMICIGYKNSGDLQTRWNCGVNFSVQKGSYMNYHRFSKATGIIDFVQ